MKQFKETEKLILFEEVKNGIKKIFRQNKDDVEENKILIIVYKKGNIEFEFDSETIKKIVIENSDEIPFFLSSYGYGFSEKSLNNFFKYNFSSNQIDKIILSQTKSSGKSGKSLIFNYDDIESLLSSINQEQRACNDTKKNLIKNLIVQAFPNINFDYQETNNNKDLIFVI